MAANRTVVLVGKTGNGKSATGNSILGKKEFESKISAVGVTTTCTKKTIQLEGDRIINVIDTPGLFDFSRGHEFLINEILKCFEIAKDGGVHALLVVLSLSKGFSEEEKNAVAYLTQLFGEKIKDYMIIVFTGGDQLETYDESIKDFILRDPSKQLKEIMDMCDNKYVLFNNMTNDKVKKSDQRDELISRIDEVSSINKQTPITKDMFLQALKSKQNAGSSTKVFGLINVQPIVRFFAERLRTSNPMMRNLILVGRTGNGKSATGNSILGRKEFKSKVSAVGVTTTSAKGTITLEDGRIINVIDTPGFYDFSGDPGPIQEEIINCTMGLKGDDGIHAVLVVLSLKNRFTKEENDAVSFLKKACFSDKISGYMIVVLTGGDELEANDVTIDNLMGHDNCPEPLKDILEMCGNRCVVMDNRTKDERKKAKQLVELFGLVEKVFVDNGRKPYMEDITQMNPMRNLILVGRTGNGKSATGNSILGKKEFISKISADGVTTTCAKGTVKAGGQTINVINTPGYYDFSGDPEPIQKEIIDCMKGLEKDGGIHAVLVVLSLKNRFSKEEKDAISFLKACFSAKISNYMIVVLTGGDELEANDETIDTLMGHDCPEPLKDILEMCGNRYVVMDNKTEEKDKKDEQLKKLYCLVEKVLEDNGQKPYMEDITQMNLGGLNQFSRNAYMEKEQDENMQLNSTKDPKRREAEDPSGTGETKSSPINKIRTIVNSKTKNFRKR